jgi:tetratricopeptide (TPR) repeat protein
VAGALKVTLLGDVAAKVELGGTHNAAAFDAYLRGRKLFQIASTGSEQQGAIAAYTEALRLDPGYALALAPGDARILRASANFISWMGHPEAGITAARRAVTLDRLKSRSQRTLGVTLYNARRYSDAIAADQADIAFEPSTIAYARRGESFYALSAAVRGISRTARPASSPRRCIDPARHLARWRQPHAVSRLT